MRVSFRIGLFFLMLGCAATLAPAQSNDGLRLGVQLGGTGLASLLVEYDFSDNAVCLSIGIFDSFTEPDIALWYRRYFRPAPLDAWGLTPYAGIGFAGLFSIAQPWNFIGMGGLAAGIEWSFWSILSLRAEGDMLVGIIPRLQEPVFMPALSLQARL
jgi:hypothetical protein